MAEIQRILFALELSDISARIAPWVELAVRSFQAELHVLHVVPSMEMWGTPFVSRIVESRHDEGLVDQIKPEVEEFYAAHFGDPDQARIAVVAGNPAEAIVSYVRTHAMDLVIVGTHARRGLDKAIFGSVADRVLRLSPVPVLYINPLRGAANP